AQSCPQGIHVGRGLVRSSNTKPRDAPHAAGPLLRPRRERPRHRCAEKRDELAALHLGDHSITSSARAISVGGTSMASAFAVLRLMTISNFVGACTGRSA